jgi:hypothetical protein
MDYGMIGKIEKAKFYAEERDRIQFESFTVKMNGTNNAHVVGYNGGTWQCDCDFFRSRGDCAHTRAMEQVLSGMVRLNA